MTDTREKRQSAASLLMPFRPRGVDPDPGIDKAERQATAHTYSGIEANTPGMDTREERQSAYAFLMPFFPRGVDPDPGIDQFERRATAHMYAGILVGPPIEVVPGGELLDELDVITHIRGVLR